MKRLILLLISFVFTLSTYAQIIGTLSYQGYLTDDNGEPVSDVDPHTFIFTFYDDTGTAQLTRGPISKVVTNGLFTVLIGGEATGNNTPLPLDIWDQDYSIGITVDSEDLSSELTPRIPLASVPYSFHAEIANVANSVAGSDITGTVSGTLIDEIAASKITGTIPSTQLDEDLLDLSDGELTGSKVGTGINADNITSGTLANARLDPDVQDLADDGLLSADKLASGISADKITTGTLSGTLVGTGVNASNITTGTLDGSLLDAVDASIINGSITTAQLDDDLEDLADGTLTGTKVGTGIDAQNVTVNTIAIANGGTNAATVETARTNLGLEIGSNVQGYDADLDDLADGELSGVKVGEGIDAVHITTGTLPNGRLDANLQTLIVDLNIDSKISGATIDSGIDAANITTGTLPNGRLDTDLQNMASGNVDGSFVGTGIDAANISTGKIPDARLETTVNIANLNTTGTTQFDGFTTLGNDVTAPAIKMKTFSGTTSAFEGFDFGINTGVAQSKIISIQIMIDNDPTAGTTLIPPNYSTDDETESIYSWYLTSSQIRIVGHSTSSGDLLNANYKVSIIYTQ